MKIKTEGKWMWEEPDQPNPATGEWTRWQDSLLSLRLPDGSQIECSSTSARDEAIIAHNAALAAAYKQGYGEAVDCKIDAHLTELREQLAAEREVGHNQAVTLGQHIARLEDQLAAAVEALKECRVKLDWSVCDGQFIDKIDSAIAKIQKP